MFLVSSCSCRCPTHWSQVLSENEAVVGAALTGCAPTTCEWSTMLLPTKVRLILETLRYLGRFLFCCVSMVWEEGWRGVNWGRDKMATILQTIFSNAFSWMNMKFVLRGRINNTTLVHIMAWHQPSDRPLSEPMMVYLRIYASLGLNGINGAIWWLFRVFGDIQKLGEIHLTPKLVILDMTGIGNHLMPASAASQSEAMLENPRNTKCACWNE